MIAWTTLKHWCKNKMADILQITFSNAFAWMKTFQFQLNFNWGLFLRVKLTLSQYWFRWWIGTKQGANNYLNQRWPNSDIYMHQQAPKGYFTGPSGRCGCNFRRVIFKLIPGIYILKLMPQELSDNVNINLVNDLVPTKPLPEPILIIRHCDFFFHLTRPMLDLGLIFVY